MQAKRAGDEIVHTETHVRQILNSDRKTVDKLRDDVLKGADFAKLAEQHSQDSTTASKGGDMGWVTENSVSSKFYNVIAKLRNNELSEAVHTEDGWSLIQVLDRRTQRSSDEAATSRAVELLTMRKTNEALEVWMKRIRDEAHVEILVN